MTEEKDTPGGVPVGDTPPAARTVTVEDLQRFQSIYDQKIDAGEKTNKTLLDEIIGLKADLQIAQESAGGDAAKVIERERELRRKAVILEQGQAALAQATRQIKAREVVAEAKATWGLDLNVEELAKLEPGEMTLTVMRLVASAKVEPTTLKPRLVLGGQGSPVQHKPRYAQDDLTNSLTKFLQDKGRMPR